MKDLPAFDPDSMEVKAQTPDGYTIAKRGRGFGGFVVYRGVKNLTPLAEWGLWTEAARVCAGRTRGAPKFRSERSFPRPRRLAPM